MHSSGIPISYLQFFMPVKLVKAVIRPLVDYTVLEPVLLMHCLNILMLKLSVKGKNIAKNSKMVGMQLVV